MPSHRNAGTSRRGSFRVAAKNYVPKQLRKRSELFDQFMIRKGELSRNKAIGLARIARNCAKLGIRFAEAFE